MAYEINRTWVCEQCGAEIPGPELSLGDRFVCDRCFREYLNPLTVSEFVKSDPAMFAEFIEEWAMSGVDEALSLLRQYRDWNENEYERWFRSNEVL